MNLFLHVFTSLRDWVAFSSREPVRDEPKGNAEAPSLEIGELLRLRVGALAFTSWARCRLLDLHQEFNVGLGALHSL